MVTREIIKIDIDKCNGCGLCIPNCPEGALQIINDKAVLVSDLFCDGLGACIGHCPQNAIKIEKREAKDYDENKVMENIVKQGEDVIEAHLNHLAEHNQSEFLNQAIAYLEDNHFEIPQGFDYKQEFCACPGSMVKEIKTNNNKQNSNLTQWPIQLHLLPPQAPFFNNSNLLISADCVGFSNPNLHNQLLKDHSVAIGCPKLDDTSIYEDKIRGIIENNEIKSITVAIMEVPCCFGLYTMVENILEDTSKNIPLNKIVVNINGTTK